ncbi:Cytochrome P450 monooxygenase yanC [Colletotrichum orbiculare MAFF 240422]|uniref:Cytochrome P450 monooxygenase yanC n=1 Tax=Colletotrichum orbiculare (strain 104-T / ATCC 96160 / CBS 514.97 / LARS 414 / MAFF 240422) TaxID=1213857 RepID=A0A484FPL2_COLOR|nr:Cytochrome P450 monooxygenase yanC [Colletotrichum orbiculare MAFF 240422]
MADALDCRLGALDLEKVTSGPRPALAAVVVFLVFASWIWNGKTCTSKRPLPPQPPAKPVIGHLHEIVRENKARRWHLRLNDWARRYGPIFGVRTGYIVDYYVNSDQLVKDLFDKRSAQTADRPVWTMSSTIMNNDFNPLFLNASDPRWKNQRKVIQQLLTNAQRADKIVPLLEYETLRFLHENVIPETDDPVIDYIMESEIQILNTFPGSNVIDLLPALGKLPLFLKAWEKWGRARYHRDVNWAMKRVKAVEDRLGKGDSSFENTFIGSVLQHEDMRGLASKEELANLSLGLIVGAADTSRMTTWAFLEAMMMFPEVQAKAREEIDRVVGDRIPSYEDFGRIPYVRMMMKELWRWRPPVALGHPHITARDLEVGGYRLPKGARLHINAYAIGHDPARHEDPDRFWPERYQDDETTTMESINSQDPTKRDHFAFGAGRRVCPGYHVAERSFVTTMMRILWAFDVAPAPGTKKPLVFADYAGALPGNPAHDMPVKLWCRSESRKATVLRTLAEQNAARPDLTPLNMGENVVPPL